jgi:hypothetical protein
MKGLRAMAAKSIRELVAELAGRASSMMLPRGKFVPYRHATAANSSLGPMYEFMTLSTKLCGSWDVKLGDA